MNKRLAIITVSAALAGGAAGMVINIPGLASAQSDNGTDTTQTITAASGAEAAAAEQAPTDLPPAMAAAIKGLVDNGTLTQTQADAVTKALLDARPEGRGPRGPRDGGLHIRGGLDGVAAVLGVTEDELHTALEAGKSIADVAKEKGVDVQKVIDSLVAKAKERTAQAVTDGKITQAQADERIAALTDNITKMVNGELPSMPEGRPGFRGHHGRFGEPPADANADPNAASGTGTSA
ncbi:MAG TPA: hypothetical protein VF855_08285 [Acidimicrobiales bacterium]